MAEQFLSLTSVDTLLDLIAQISPLDGEVVSLEKVTGRVLMEDLIAKEDIPPLPRSTMDGFAVRAQDVFGASDGLPSLLDCIGECKMGEVSTLQVGTAEAVRIWTGGMVPFGANAVVMVEYTETISETHIEITRPVAPLENIIEQGEDAVKGDILLQKGHVIRVQDIGLLAALGINNVLVQTRPKVAVISSGDEVVPVTSLPMAGQVRDVNTWTIAAHAESCGAESRSFGIIPDKKELLEKTIEKALCWADVVLVSGGSSVGARDFSLAAIQAQKKSTILVHGVAISPGKPLIFAKSAEKIICGLPGHVTSALICADVFIRPLLYTLMGQKNATPVWAKHIKARLTRALSSAQGRRDYIRVALEESNDPLVPLLAHPVRGKSGLISTLVKADGLIICPEELEGLEEGSIVDVHVFSGSRSGI